MAENTSIFKVGDRVEVQYRFPEPGKIVGHTRGSLVVALDNGDMVTVSPHKLLREPTLVDGKPAPSAPPPAAGDAPSDFCLASEARAQQAVEDFMAGRPSAFDAPRAEADEQPTAFMGGASIVFLDQLNVRGILNAIENGHLDAQHVDWQKVAERTQAEVDARDAEEIRLRAELAALETLAKTLSADVAALSAERDTVMRRALTAMGALGNALNWDAPVTLDYTHAMNALQYALGMTELMPPDYPRAADAAKEQR